MNPFNPQASMAQYRQAPSPFPPSPFNQSRPSPFQQGAQTAQSQPPRYQPGAQSYQGATPAQSSQFDPIAAILSGQNPAEVAARTLQTNPEFSAFVEQNRGRDPYQMAREMGFDLEGTMRRFGLRK